MTQVIKVGRRFGAFSITSEWFATEEGLQRVRRVLQGMIVVHASYNSITDHFEYTAMSEMFEPVADDAQVTKYSVEFIGNVLSLREIK